MIEILRGKIGFRALCTQVTITTINKPQISITDSYRHYNSTINAYMQHFHRTDASRPDAYGFDRDMTRAQSIKC